MVDVQQSLLCGNHCSSLQLAKKTVRFLLTGQWFITVIAIKRVSNTQLVDECDYITSHAPPNKEWEPHQKPGEALSAPKG
jgi:hypothetical protein